MNTYTHHFSARCPNNATRIAYKVAITSPQTIMVEEIVEFCASIGEGFHEDIADELLERFGGSQVMEAHHHGVDIKTQRSAA